MLTKFKHHKYFLRIVYLRIAAVSADKLLPDFDGESGLSLKTGDILQAASAWPAALFGVVSYCFHLVLHFVLH